MATENKNVKDNAIRDARHVMESMADTNGPNNHIKTGPYGEYRSIRLEEWQQGNKILRNWTYVNSLPLDGRSVSIESHSHVKEGNSVRNEEGRGGGSAEKTAERGPTKDCGSKDPGPAVPRDARASSPLGRQRKQKRVENRELQEMVDEEKRRLVRDEQKLGRMNAVNAPTSEVTSVINTNEAIQNKREEAVQTLGGKFHKDAKLREQWADTMRFVEEASGNLNVCKGLAGERILPGVHDYSERMNRVAKLMQNLDDQLTVQKSGRK